jgi:hypothetical protein
MNTLIAWDGQPERRNDPENRVEGDMLPSAIVAVSGPRHRLAVDSPVLWAADRPTREAPVDTADGLTTPASGRGIQTPLPETDPQQPSRPNVFARDPSLSVPVIATAEDIVRARELRQQLRKKYPNRLSQPCSLWCVGVE